jgi:branched-subunit amino acid ABC-type transport system permease component
MPENLMPELNIPHALIGQIVVFSAFALIVYLMAREAAKVVIKILLVVGIGLAVAVATGWLEQSQVIRWLEQVGDWMIAGIQAVVDWIVRAWEAVGGKGR